MPSFDSTDFLFWPRHQKHMAGIIPLPVIATSDKDIFISVWNNKEN